MTQMDMFKGPKENSVTSGRKHRKPWEQRRDEMVEYHRKNKGVLEKLILLTKDAIDVGVRGDAQRLYVEFNEFWVEPCETWCFPKFPREYITFYVRMIMLQEESTRGYYKLNRQDGEPEFTWRKWKNYRDDYGTRV